MFPAINKTRALILFLLTFITINLSISSLYYFHEPSKTKLNKAYKDYYKGYKSADEYIVENVYSKDDIRYKLAKAFPYEKSIENIPKNIFQMWKNTDINSLDKGLQDLIATWRTQEAEEKGGFKYELIGDEQLDLLVNKTFESVPEIIEAFNRFPTIILKSDFMRYLLVFSQGGVYSDIDTSLNKDILDWLPYHESLFGNENKVGVVIGIESDRDEKNWARNGMARRLQFCQWSLQSKIGHPFFRELIFNIANLAINHFDTNTNILTKNGKQYDMNKGSPTKFAGIMEWTGPGQFTDTVFKYLNDVYKTSEKIKPGLNFSKEKIINPNLDLDLQSKVRYPRLRNSYHNEYSPEEGRPIGWQNITHQVHPILYDDDVLLMPIVAFNGKKGDVDDWTQHHFKGSWKN